MSDARQLETPVGKLLETVEQALAGTGEHPAQLDEARRGLRELVEEARRAHPPAVTSCASLLSGLLEITLCLSEDRGAAGEDPSTLIDFLKEGLAALRKGLQDGPGASKALRRIEREARRRWGDYLDLLQQQGSQATRNDEGFWGLFEGLSDDLERLREEHDEGQEPSLENIELILATLAAAERDRLNPQSCGVTLLTDRLEPTGGVGQGPEARSPFSESPPSRAEHATADPLASLPAPPVAGAIEADAELLAAYLDDAKRCLASMEAALLVFETEVGHREPLQQFCRDLHTLKGASASVGLTQLAQYLHALEDHVQSCCRGDRDVDIETLLAGLDAVRAQIAALSGGGAASDDRSHAGAQAGTSPSTAPRSVGSEPVSSQLDRFVRVEGARLDRLMDLLAELVLLRNRRDTHVARFKHVHGELIRGVGRIRTLGDSLGRERPKGPTHLPRPGQEFAGSAEPPNGRLSLNDASTRYSSLTELATDLSELARSMRDLYQPLHDDNLTVSRLIGQFRQELMDLRRVPVEGLFRRLQRGARDAARIENKQLRLWLIGQDVGVERSLQERLYEPLLHLVRNAVSHGIEPPSQRLAAAKPPIGTLTLAARGDPASLVFEVSDDGRGLDYAALERRGRELGLLASGPSSSREQLAQLIFSPGFSTRQTINEVAGRGVGMDVVASVIERLRGQVEVESTPGSGTTIRLRIPLHSGIEHAMIVRVDGQLFALPMHCLQGSGIAGPERINGALHGTAVAPGASSAGSETLSPGVGTLGASKSGADLATVRLRDVIGLQRTAPPARPQVLLVDYRRWAPGASEGASLSSSASAALHEPTRGVALVVDAIVGPEEVVVRALPPLLRPHRLLAGVTLSGAGEIVLLFDIARLLEQGLSSLASAQPHEPHALAAPHAEGWSDAAGELARAALLAAPKVLVADDSLSARRSLCQVLARHGCAAAAAADGMEALDLLRHHDYALVLTDLEMPRLGGLELLAEIKRGQRKRSLPVVIVTSSRDEASRARALQLGAHAYLTKPVNAAALVELMGGLGLIGKPPAGLQPSTGLVVGSTIDLPDREECQGRARVPAPV